MEDIAMLAPFRRATAGDFGLTEADIRRSLRSGELLVTRRGVLVGAQRVALADDAPSRHALDAQTALAGLRGQPAVACLGSAASLHQLWRLGRPPERVRLYRERGGPWRDENIAVLVCSLPPEHVTRVQGVPATTAARTAIDLARWVTFRSGVVVLDSALRRGCARTELEEVAARCARWPGIRKARQTLAFADGRSGSPLESISRVLFCERGIPAPQLQWPLGDPEDPFAVVDFFWEEFGVVGEADGLMKYDDEDKPLALRDEKLRQEAIEAMDYIVVRWGWDDVWRRPDWVEQRIRRAFREATRRRRMI